MAFDLSKVLSLPAASEAGFTFEPAFDDGTPTGCRITVRGPESAVVRSHLQRQIAAIQARELAAKKRGRDAEPRTLDELTDDSIELAALYTMGWEGIEDAGKPLPFSQDAARKLYRDYSWLRRQVINEAQELGNFAKPSSTTSSSTPAPNSGST